MRGKSQESKGDGKDTTTNNKHKNKIITILLIIMTPLTIIEIINNEMIIEISTTNNINQSIVICNLKILIRNIGITYIKPNYHLLS